MTDTIADMAGTQTNLAQRLVLASTSPRRRDLLARALGEGGFDVIDPGIDDGGLRPGGVPARQWVATLAYFKARAGAERLAREGRAGPGVWVLGADTLVAHRGEIIGKPRDADDARAMLAHLMNDRHDVFTGVCLLPAAAGRCPPGIAGTRTLVDRAVSHLGVLAPADLEAYIASGLWRGKAGAYNIEERRLAGWPIRAEGDETCVMGLPMRAIGPWLDELRRPRPDRRCDGVAA